MADMMLDATVFLDYRAGHQGARAIVEQIVEGARTASVSPLTLFELWRERPRPQDGDRLRGDAGLHGDRAAVP